MAGERFDIQGLSDASGVSRRTIHFYVQQGLLPPPNGAGLSASYNENHLLRLRLIPVLRQQGLRLDEIRQRFQHMPDHEMAKVLQGPPSSIVPAPAQSAKLPASSDEASSGHRAALPLRPGNPAQTGQRYNHYALPAGLILIAPEGLSPLDRQRLDKLLRYGHALFTGGLPEFRSVQEEYPRAPEDDGESNPGGKSHHDTTV